MFGKRKAVQAAPASSAGSDQYQVKASGERVTVLSSLGRGEVKVARDRNGVSREAIMREDDLKRA